MNSEAMRLLLDRANYWRNVHEGLIFANRATRRKAASLVRKGIFGL